MLKRIKRASGRVKIISLFLILIASIVISGWAFGYGLNNNNDGLVLDIDFSEENYNSSTRTFADKSGNNNHAVSTNPAVFAPDKDGKSTGAMRFDGLTDKITTEVGFTAAEDATYSVWFNHSGTGLRTIIGSSIDTGTIRMSNGSLQMYWDPVTVSQSAGFTVPSGTWNHIVVVKTNGQNKIYFNGILLWSPTVSNVNINGIKFGQQDSRTDRMFSGYMAQAKIYNRALSEQEVRGLYLDSKPKTQFTSLEKGLIGYWLLNGQNFNSSTNRLTDKSGYSSHGIVSGATLSPGRFGESNGSFDFGTINNGYSINIENQNFAGLSDFTMSSWVLVKGNHLHYDGTIISSGNWNNTHWSFGLTQNNTGIRTRNPSVAAPYTFLPDRWYHVVYMRRGTDLKFFVDGELTYTKYDANYIPLTSGYPNTKIGMDTYTSDYFNFNGKISEVRMYNRALSDAEVNALYNYYSPGAGDSLQKGLVLDFPLTSEYTKGGVVGSEIVTDKSANSNDAVNFGGTITNDYTSFNGTNQYIGNIGNPELLEPSSITVSSWINMDTDASLLRHIWFTKWYGYSCEIAANTRIPYFRLNGPGDFYSSVPITPGKWHHFVGTYDPAVGGKVYLDGVLVGSRATSIAITHTRNFPLNIGRYAGGIYFKGKISDAKIYNRALTADEVKSLYDRGKGVSGAVFNGL